MSRRALVAYGDVTQVATWSNVPYFFLQAGCRSGLFQAGVVLRPERFRARRLVWNALRPLAFDAPRGFMYSRSHLRALWADRRVPSEIDEYVSHYQLLPPRDVVRDPITYYIDATMRQFFEDYSYRIGKRIRADALARERDAYRSARFVVCMSQWCADDVVSFYDVPRQQVRVIHPGANIDDALIPSPPRWEGDLSPLRLGFIGVDWERKGGPVLLEVATALQRMGHSVEVIVVGPDPSRIPFHPAVRAIGFVDKAREPQRFVALARSFHFGCLLSRAEAYGFSTRESLRLGVPVVATAVGGLAELPEDACLLVPSERTSESLAEELDAVIRTPERYAKMREAAERAGSYYTWDRAAHAFLALLDE